MSSLEKVRFGSLRRAFFHHPREQVADGFDLQHRRLGGRFHGAQDVENPRLPRAAFGHLAEVRVVVAFVLDDVAAEEKDRLLEQALLEQVRG